MDKLGRGWCWIFLVIVFVSIASADDEIPSTETLDEIQLSTVELQYLNERLQTKDHMSLDDAMNTIIELEHFYTLMKYDEAGHYSPSYMVDKAWHQHILHTRMYQNFSRQYFGVDILHHLPFWSGNIEEVKKAQGDQEVEKDATYNKLISLFGPKNINATVWLLEEEEHDLPPSNTTQHTEF